MTTMIDTKNIGNTIYHAAFLSALTVGYGMAGKYLLKTSIGDPSKPNLTEALKLTGAVTLAIMTKGWLEKEGVPKDIIK